MRPQFSDLHKKRLSHKRLDKIKKVPEVCAIFAATANPLEIIIAETAQGRGIIGVVDGLKSKGIETDANVKERREFLRKIGYKLG